MKFEELKEYPHEEEFRAMHKDKNWRVYFPNGYGVDIVGGPQNTNTFIIFNGQVIHVDPLYGDGINTFEVAKFKHNLSITEPKQGIISKINPSKFFDCEEYITKDRVNEILTITEFL